LPANVTTGTRHPKGLASGCGAVIRECIDGDINLPIGRQMLAERREESGQLNS
jgi:hypothetical protein